MKRGNVVKKIFSLILTLLLLSTTILPGNALAYTVLKEDRWGEPIAEGVNIEKITQSTSEGTLKIYVMKVDLTNPYVKVDTLTGGSGKLTGASPVTKMVSDAGAVAGINGDFFQMDEKAPIGLTVQSGNIVSSPAQRTDMYGFGLTTEKVPFIDIFEFTGQVTAANGQTFPLFGVNKPTYLVTGGASSDKDKLNMYTPLWGQKSRGKLPELTETVEVVVENDVVKEIRTNLPGITIPQKGYVLSANGQAAQWVKTNLKAGDAISASYDVAPQGDKLLAAVGGQAMLVNYGKRSWFTQNITGKRARTALGYTQDRKTMYLVVVEGGSSSRGMTQEELADFMVSLGCWQAINLDGGGSSTMAARLLGDETVSLQNKPQQGTQRPVPTGIGIFTTAPRGAFAGFKISGERFLLVGTSSGPYTAKGYDEHYNPYKVEAGQITWSIEPALGTFEGNVLKATESGRAQVIASYNGVSQPYDVNILGAGDIAKVEISPNVINLNEGDSVGLSVAVTAKNGVKFNVKASEVQWEVTGDVGRVEGEKFIAAGTSGVGQLTVSIDGLKASAPVNIGFREKAYSGLEAYKDYKFSGYPAEITGKFRAATETEPVFRGTGAAVLEYDLTRASSTGAAYGKFGQKGLELPGTPLGIGVWVYGNGGKGHWLRARIVDANGTEKLVDLAQSVNWQGWKHVTGKFPAGLKYPVRLESLYVVETDLNRMDKGRVIFDELTLLMPITAADLSASKPIPQIKNISIDPQQATKGSLGDYLTVNLPAGGVKADTLCLSEEWELTKPTPGYNPVMPVFNIEVKNSAGSAAGEISRPITVTAKYTGNSDIKKVKLLRWNQAGQKWVTVPQKINEGPRTITAKTQQPGLYALMVDARPVPVFGDIGNSWAKTQIEQMAQMRVVSGFPGNKFLPDKGVTRAEFMVLMANLFGWTAEDPNLSFRDSLPDWARSAIAAGVENGIVKGYGDGTFQPNKKISRAEMAVMIDNCLNLPNSDKPSAYADAGEIPGWATQAIRDTKTAGLLKGNNNMFRPRDTASRAEATTVLYNVLNYYMAEY